MADSQEVSKTVARSHRSQPDGQDRNSNGCGPLELLQHMIRFIGGFRKDQDKYVGAPDGLDNLTWVKSGAFNIPRRDPALNPSRFERMAGRLSNHPISRRMAHKDQCFRGITAHKTVS